MSDQENDIAATDESVVAAPGNSKNTDATIDSEVDSESATDQTTTNEEVDIAVLLGQLENEKEQARQNLETVLRTQAEMENLRKRTVRDVENAHKYALDKFVNELLPVLDSLELGVSAADGAENVDDLKQGMDLTLKMLNTALEKFGVKKLEPQGEKFNPEQHEAVTMQELEDSEPGTVVGVMQKGYELNGRLVRPAMVIVAK